MHKRASTIVKDTVSRWARTLLQTGPADVAGATKLIHKVYGRDVKVFTVNTPLEFYIAQAVIRRRMTKKYAQKEACKLVGIDPGFIDNLAGVGAPLQPFNGQSWYRHITTNIMDRTIISFIKKVCDGVGFDAHTTTGSALLASGGRRWRPRRPTAESMQVVMQYTNCDLHGLFRQFIPWGRQRWMVRAGWPTEEIDAMEHKMNFTTNKIESACMTVYDAVSKQPMDIIGATPAATYKCENHAYDATQTEMICRLIGCRDPEITINYEMFHHVPAIMAFHKAFLLLGNRPSISLNDEDNIHSETGRAVAYNDGSGFWFLDGHILQQAGEKIVLKPETLTAMDIQEIENEEERRLAIERYGWEPYLKDVGAKVIDRRENWVDNTIEALIEVPATTLSDGTTTRESRRMLLSCRSTGRRYMLAAPMSTSPAWWRRESAKALSSCESVQDWMSNGANTEHLTFAKNKLHVVGAS